MDTRERPRRSPAALLELVVVPAERPQVLERCRLATVPRLHDVVDLHAAEAVALVSSQTASVPTSSGTTSPLPRV
jgi:hypothetical protein